LITTPANARRVAALRFIGVADQEGAASWLIYEVMKHLRIVSFAIRLAAAWSDRRSVHRQAKGDPSRNARIMTRGSIVRVAKRAAQAAAI
jgi:hypothetical protein